MQKTKAFLQSSYTDSVKVDLFFFPTKLCYYLGGKKILNWSKRGSKRGSLKY